MKNESLGMDRTTLDQVRDGAIELPELLSKARSLVPDPEGRAALVAGMRERLFAGCRDESIPAEALSELKTAIKRIGALGRGLSQASELDALLGFSAQMDAFADLTADLMAFNEAYDARRLRDMPHFHACLTYLVDAPEGRLDRAVLRDRLGLSQSNLTRVLNTLEKARLIRRRPNANRGVTVELTNLGRKLEFEWSDRSALRSALAPDRPRPRVEPALEIEGLIAGVPNRPYPAQYARLRVGAR